LTRISDEEGKYLGNIWVIFGGGMAWHGMVTLIEVYLKKNEDLTERVITDQRCFAR